MKFIKIIKVIILSILSTSANAEVTFKVNYKNQTINIIDTENNENIVTSIHNITTQQSITSFARSFYVYISSTKTSIRIDENTFNEINNELMKE